MKDSPKGTLKVRLKEPEENREESQGLIQPAGCGHLLNLIWAADGEGTEDGGIEPFSWAWGDSTKLPEAR